MVLLSLLLLLLLQGLLLPILGGIANTRVAREGEKRAMPVSHDGEAAFRAHVQSLAGLPAHEWYGRSEPGAAATAWWHALAACSSCTISAELLGAAAGDLLVKLAYFRALPDRRYYWHTIMPVLAHVTIPERLGLDAATDHHVRVRVLSIGLEWYSIEDQFQLYSYLDSALHNRVEFHTMDLNPRVQRLRPPNALHCTGNAMRLPESCNTLDGADSVDIILLNGVIGWGIDDDASLAALLHSLSVTLRPGGILLVGRNVPKMCCSNVPFAEAGFVPHTLKRGLPTRRHFKQTLAIGGGHVFDVFAKQKLRDLNASLIVNIRLTVRINEESKYIHLKIPLKTGDANEAAHSVCEKGVGLKRNVAAACQGAVGGVVKRFLSIARQEAPRSKCPQRSLMLVAHFADELLFGGRALLGEQACWTVVAVAANKDGNGANMRATLVSAEGYAMPFVDGPMGVPFDTDGSSSAATVEDWIYFFAKLARWDRIVTHGPLGEYGHPQHVGVYNSVRATLVELGLEERLWVFQISGWDSYSLEPDEIQKEVRQLATQVYAASQSRVEPMLHAQVDIVPVRNYSHAAAATGCDPTPKEWWTQQQETKVAFFRWFCQSLYAAYRDGLTFQHLAPTSPSHHSKITVNS